GPRPGMRGPSVRVGAPDRVRDAVRGDQQEPYMMRTRVGEHGGEVPVRGDDELVRMPAGQDDGEGVRRVGEYRAVPQPERVQIDGDPGGEPGPSGGPASTVRGEPLRLLARQLRGAQRDQRGRYREHDRDQHRGGPEPEPLSRPGEQEPGHQYGQEYHG